MTTISPIGSSPPGYAQASPGASSKSEADKRNTQPGSTSGSVSSSSTIAALTGVGSQNSGSVNDATNGDQKQSQPSLDELQKALKDVKDSVSTVAHNLQFSIDEELGRTVVKVVDSSTKEVIRQIPSEEMLAIAKALDRESGEKTSGVFVKQQA